MAIGEARRHYCSLVIPAGLLGETGLQYSKFCCFASNGLERGVV